MFRHPYVRRRRLSCTISEAFSACGTSLGRGKKRLSKWSRLQDQDGRHGQNRNKHDRNKLKKHVSASFNFSFQGMNTT